MAHPGGISGKPLLECALNLSPCPADHRAKANVESVLGVGLADEVEHRQDALALRPPQAATELLQEHGRALGRAQEQDRVDLGNVDAFVEDVDREDRSNLAAPKLTHGLEADVSSTVSPSSATDGRPAA